MFGDAHESIIAPGLIANGAPALYAHIVPHPIARPTMHHPILPASLCSGLGSRWSGRLCSFTLSNNFIASSSGSSEDASGTHLVTVRHRTLYAFLTLSYVMCLGNLPVSASLTKVSSDAAACNQFIT